MVLETWRTIQCGLAAIGAIVGGFLGGIDGIMYTLIALIVIDYITGFMVAIVEKKLSSEVGYRGIFKKVCILMLVGVANLIDTYVIGQGAVLRTAVIFFFISNEGVSILENAGRLGLPIPEKLRAVLAQLKDDGEAVEEDDNADD